MKNDIFETRENVLFVDGISSVRLAKEYGTPLLVYSYTEISRRLSELQKAFLEKYTNTRVAYASKAFLTLAMCNIIEKAGLSLDVVSGGELYTAIKAGFPAERIEFHGNNKSPEELEMAIKYGVGYIIIDGYDELDIVEAVCEKLNARTKVLFRISPEVHADTHDAISTGKRDSKFGISIDQDKLFPLIQKAMASSTVELTGLHFHIGSQLFKNDGYLKALDTVLPLYKQIKSKLGHSLSELNIGGGFGINYTKEDNRQEFSYFLDPVMKKVETYCKENSLDLPIVIIEPGRSIVGEAGLTLYTVGSIKEIEGSKKYVAVDGGMTDNIRKALYNASYEAILANKAGEASIQTVSIVGKCCESGDKLIEEASLARAERGDILAIFSTGAYCYSMASNYNKHTLPAVALVEKGKAQLIVKRQSYEDMTQNELPLS